MLNFTNYANLSCSSANRVASKFEGVDRASHSERRSSAAPKWPRLAHPLRRNDDRTYEQVGDHRAGSGCVNSGRVDSCHPSLVLLWSRPNGHVGVDVNEDAIVSGARRQQVQSPRQQAQPVQQDVSPAPVQTVPSIGQGHPEYHFVQSIMEMQKSLGQINASIESLTKTVDSTKSKVEDLVKWKNMIFGGAIVIGLFCSLAGFAVTKFSGYVTIKAPEDQVQTSKPAPPPEEHSEAPAQKTKTTRQ